MAMITADVSDSADVQRYLAETVARWGKIDVLFSHAGISGVIKPVTEYPEDVFDAVMAINVRGSFLACKYGLPQMNDGGSLIITSSIIDYLPNYFANGISFHQVTIKVNYFTILIIIYLKTSCNIAITKLIYAVNKIKC